VRNILIQNLTSRTSPRMLDLRGYDRSPITNVRLVDCRFEGVDQASVLINIKDLVLDNVDMNTGEPLDGWGNPL